MALLNDQASQSRSVTIETFELSNPTSRKIIQVDKTLCGYLYYYTFYMIIENILAYQLIWAMVNTHYMVDGHPIHNKDPYNGYYKSLWTIGWLAPINGY